MVSWRIECGLSERFRFNYKIMHKSDKKDISISIIIPTRNRGSLLRSAIESVWRQKWDTEKTEIIVIDNWSTDDTPEVVERLKARSPCRIEYMKTPANLGPAFSRNMGVANARGEYVVFLDSDVCLGPEWIARAVSAISKDPCIGIVAGKLLYLSMPGKINSFGGEVNVIGLGWDAHDGEDESAVTDRLELLWVSTAATICRRSLFDRVGTFDDKYFFGYEDLDFCWRANIAGYRVVCMPDLVAYHNFRRSKVDMDFELAFHYCKNRLRTLIKNFSAPYLIMALGLYLGYTLLDIVLRAPRVPKIRAIFWNIREFRDTLWRRTEVQKLRKERDSKITSLFSARLIPPVPIRQRQRHLLENIP